MAWRLLLGFVLLTAVGCTLTAGDIFQHIILPEQGGIAFRDPSQFAPGALPPTVPPRTVSDPRPGTTEWQLSLNDAIRIALENACVIRILAGTTATASGQTIYDAAITNTTIDQAAATFDPGVKWNNTWNRTNVPTATFVSNTGGVPGIVGTTAANTVTGSPTGGATVSTTSSQAGLTNGVTSLTPSSAVNITSTPTDGYIGDLGLTKTNVLGGKWALDSMENPTRITAPGPFPLNPQTPSSLTLSYTQPLLQGAGFNLNMAPIVIARLNTEQSFFQYKDSVQELVRGVVEGYWSLVQARVNVWARKIQEEQSKEAYEREDARFKTGFSDVGTVSQTRVTYYQFKANRIAAEADVLTREGALRNLLGLAPNDCRQIIPTSAPASQRLPHDWDALVSLAEQRRPDIVELKIIVEADHQRLIQAQDQSLPRLDAVAQYRWNGLSGELPNEDHLSSSPGQFPDWSIGINFSVPLGFRQGRAQARQQMLLIARDRANVEQQLHLAVHQLAATLRDLDSAYEQYLAFKETRTAADINLRVQLEKFRAGQTIYLNVLQALNDWGTAVSSEAQQLLIYNTSLANLERQTGTILETHGLIFFEERFRAAGPLICKDRLYPSAQPPAGAPKQYPGTGEPSENAFDLQSPVPRERKQPQELPPPRLVKPEP
jgi:outer membrane protein TolC